MTFIAYVVAFVTALGLFTYLCIPKGRYRGAATAVFVILAGGAFALSFEAAGQPKPIEIEWRKLINLPVVGFLKNEEAKVIYFWVMRDGVPVGYVYPWSDRVQALEDLWRARGQFDGMLITGDDEVADVRAEPQMPPKEFEP